MKPLRSPKSQRVLNLRAEQLKARGYAELTRSNAEVVKQDPVSGRAYRIVAQGYFQAAAVLAECAARKSGIGQAVKEASAIISALPATRRALRRAEQIAHTEDPGPRHQDDLDARLRQHADARNAAYRHEGLEGMGWDGDEGD
jgi:hypothetical protein